jgi:hypothetical protein
MLASATDDGVTLAVVEARTKLLTFREVELEAEYAKSGYFLAARRGRR